MRVLKMGVIAGIVSVAFAMCLAAPALGQSATATFGGSGTGTTSTTNTLNGASQEDLESAMRGGLSKANASDTDIGALGRQITGAATGIRQLTQQVQGETISFFLQSATDVRKFAVSIVPGRIQNPLERDITPIHEEGHQTLDERSVTRVNDLIASGRAGVTTRYRRHSPSQVLRRQRRRNL